MSITERAKDMGVEELVKKNKKLEKEIENLNFKLGKVKTHRWVDVHDMKWKVENQKVALKKMQETNIKLKEKNERLKEENERLRFENKYRANIVGIIPEGEGKVAEETIQDLQARIKELKDRIDVLYEFIERNDKLVDEVIDEEDLDKLNRYIYIDDDLVDRTLESED